MTRTRLARLGLLLGCGVLALTACGSGGSSNSASGGGPIRIALNNTNDSLSVEVAQQEGFFKKHNITITPKTLSDITLVPSLLGKQYDVGFSVGPIMIRAAAQGVPIVAISGNDGDSPQDQGVQIFARKGITSVKQLQGKRIGSPTLTGNINIATKAWLSGSGVNPTGEQFVQVATPNMIDQLQAGQVDAVELIYPFITLAKQAGFTSLGDPERVLSSNYVGGTYWTADKAWATANPTEVDNFRAAMSDADKWITANPAAAYQISATYTKVTPAQAKLAPLGPYTTDVSAADLKIWGDAMHKFGGFGGSVDYSSLVFTGGK
ncbi:MAG TPA: ABC transporter substrate-binding protein [Pseudonocardiaceae bacterium]|nr:ABC transporter substrate-binding protein [Pseudonocardiaceae bacterium]